jgi:lipoate-protein ligase B
MVCRVYEAGQVVYSEAYQLQCELRRLRIEAAIPDVLLLLEHPPTLSVGKRGRMENVLVPMEDLRGEGIDLFFSERGGDVTYHGPGQMVAYPILSLKERGRDVYQFVRDLEAAALRTLADFGITAERDENHAGVWVGGAEIAAVGLSIKKWVTMHGLALNVNPDLSHFSLIHPCGLAGVKATSMAELLGGPVSMQAVRAAFVRHFSLVLGLPVLPGNFADLGGLYPAGFQKPVRRQDRPPP